MLTHRFGNSSAQFQTKDLLRPLCCCSISSDQEWSSPKRKPIKQAVRDSSLLWTPFGIFLSVQPFNKYGISVPFSSKTKINILIVRILNLHFHLSIAAFGSVCTLVHVIFTLVNQPMSAVVKPLDGEWSVHMVQRAKLRLVVCGTHA